MDLAIIKNYFIQNKNIIKFSSFVLLFIILCLLLIHNTIGIATFVKICFTVFSVFLNFIFDIGLFILPITILALLIITGIVIYKKNMQKFNYIIMTLLILFTAGIVRIHMENLTDPETIFFIMAVKSGVFRTIEFAFIFNSILLFLLARFNKVNFYYFYIIAMPFILLFSLVRFG